MGRLRAQRGGARKEGEVEDQDQLRNLSLPVFALSATPYHRSFSPPHVLFLFHDSSLFSSSSSSSSSSRRTTCDEAEDEGDHGEGEETASNEGDEDEGEHVCSGWIDLLREFFAGISELEEDPPVIFLVDVRRLEALQAAEAATALRQLGPISKQLSRVIGRLNPQRFSVVAQGIFCEAFLRLLQSTDATATTSALWSRLEKLYFIDPQLPRRLLQSGSGGTPTLVLLSSPSFSLPSDDQKMLQECGMFSRVMEASGSSDPASHFLCEVLARRLPLLWVCPPDTDSALEGAGVEVVEVQFVQNRFSKQIEQTTTNITYLFA